jgi:SAM-dependent methyltransferase
MRLFYPQGYYNGRDVETNLNRYAAETAFLPKLTAEKVLDIGCARGDFLCFLKRMYANIELYGVDYFSDGVTSGDIHFYKQPLTKCAFETGKFDIVTAWAVFEHLHKPSEYFQEVSRILKDGGKFIFLVTNAESLLSRMGFLEDVPRHTYHFSERTLAKYAHKYGFKLSRCIYDDGIYDGRGIGTFHFMLSRLVGITWEKKYFRKVNRVQQRFANIGSFLDKVIFSTHWEAKLGRSGIMVAEFIK